MSSTGDPLVRRYQRLLRCYPRAYRRERGAELLDLLLDTTPAGRTRPAVRVAVDLVRSGLRCRLGRPASRTVVGWAALAALICGLFSAAVATRLAWETSRPQLDRAEAGAVLGTALPEHHLGEISVPPSLFVMYDEPLRRHGLVDLLLGDGGEYREGTVTASAEGTPPVPAEQVLGLARRHLHAAGWHVDRQVDKVRTGSGPAFTESILIAGRGDTVLHLIVQSGRPGPDPGYLFVDLQRRTPTVAYPAAASAGLLGAVTGWLVFGWASRRTDRSRSARALANQLFGATMLLWWIPVALFGTLTVRQLVREPHPQWPPLWEWLGQPAGGPFLLLGSVTALLGVAVAAAG
ncbi:hypothetical protein MRQ36_13415 [Micromonospora sp. R77]|uniref:hypothetical protein n=1 Tax=Micromonospora sp. R77 TaxID=2925836 RepID=UPI001F6173E7|nr:hypothetical protein [Micromonospora sp. R77]MCI4063524.1 hypothetical protein [Micromonospora sp. R77]